MSDRKVQINFGGKQADAEPIEASQSSERWNEYLLEDGTVLKMKLVLQKVLRVEGEYDVEGNPIYIMQSSNVSTVTSPANLKRK